jgi:hypothetical protein
MSGKRIVVLCVLLVFLVGLGGPALAQGVARIIFLHHSCGENLINEGDVRDGLTDLGYEFFDHGYNDEGLRLADGMYAGIDYDVPGDNTDPDGFADIFAQPLHDPPDNTFSHLMQYDVIAFKSCFPVSNIGSDDQLAEYQSYYRAIRDRMDRHPEKLFVIVTQPPQVPANSDAGEAARARTFVDWLQSDEYLSGHPNVFVFDFFDLLAGSDGFLRPEYRIDEHDAHPNERANREIGPLFVSFVDQAIRSYGAGGQCPAPGVTTESAGGVDREGTGPPPALAPLAARTIDDFESPAGEWYADAEAGSTVECELDSEAAHGGAASLRIHYDVAPEGWGDCGRSFESPRDWSGGTGLALWLRPGEVEWMTLMVFMGDPDNPTPFEVDIEVDVQNSGDWVQHVIPWAELARAEWADEDRLSRPDPARVTGYGFSVGAGTGSLWVDDVVLAGGEEQPSSDGAAEERSGEPEEEDGREEGGGICLGATMVLPLAVLGLCHRRRR